MKVRDRDSLVLLPGGIALYEAPAHSRARARIDARRRNHAHSRLVPALLYVVLGLLNILFLLVFGGTSIRGDVMKIWSRATSTDAVEEVVPVREGEAWPEQYPPGENWSGEEEEGT